MPSDTVAPLELSDAQRQDIRTVRVFAMNAAGYVAQATAAKAALSRLKDSGTLSALDTKCGSKDLAAKAVATVESFPAAE